MFRPGLSALLMVVVFTLSHTVAATQMLLMLAWVLDLVQKVQLPAGCEVFFDNLFTTFLLLDKLSEMGIAGTGTVRQNRLFKVPIPSKKDVIKKSVERVSRRHSTKVTRF